jgi:hypothetical protein
VNAWFSAIPGQGGANCMRVAYQLWQNCAADAGTRSIDRGGKGLSGIDSQGRDENRPASI